MTIPFVRAGHESHDTLTEAGSAERFVRLHGDDVRFDYTRRHWLRWEHHRFRRDADAGVMRQALAFARDWQEEALAIADYEQKDAVIRHALRLERRDALENMLALAKTLKPVADDGQTWDRDPMLLGVVNGVVDLRTGTHRPGRRDDRVTLQTNVAFDPTESCRRWRRFLDEVFEPHPEVVPFLQRAIGYSLTAAIDEQCLFVLHGTGANGKTTLLQTMKYVLGDYALNTPFTTVEMHQRSGIPNDVAALVSRRFVMASETNDGTRLNESRVKALTGGDSISARFLHAEWFTFEPVAKFWLAVNHKPVVRDDSHGFWRRIRLVPFERAFAPCPSLSAELRDEGCGILAWAVRGCLDWQRHGLQPPAVVLDATKSYEAESDPLRPFLDEQCELVAGAIVRASDLYEIYRRWTEKNGLERERLTSTAFGRKLKERVAWDRDAHGTFYRGIARR